MYVFYLYTYMYDMPVLSYVNFHPSQNGRVVLELAIGVGFESYQSNPWRCVTTESVNTY